MPSYVAPDPPPNDDTYISEEDEDFNPDAVQVDDNISSASEADEETIVVKQKGKTTAKRQKGREKEDEAEDAGFENSGDEGIIRRGTKRKRKGLDDEYDSGGEGGFVKTRSMRAVAEKEKGRKPLASTAGTTIDVDSLWASLNSTSILPTSARPSQTSPSKSTTADHSSNATAQDQNSSSDLITITQTYTFAGKTTTETKTVPRTSVQAQVYLANQKDPSTNNPPSPHPKEKQKVGPQGQVLYTPLRRISPWEPNPTGIVKGLPNATSLSTTPANKLRTVDKSHLGWPTAAKAAKAPKLNVVDKSKMDWAEHVDKEGAREELEAARRAKGSYLERRDFLERVEGVREGLGKRVA